MDTMCLARAADVAVESYVPEAQVSRPGGAPANSATEPLLPADMTEWMPAEALAAMIARLAYRVDEATLRPVFSFRDARFYSPWAMLALLTYAYAVGAAASRAVAQRVRQDEHLRFLTQDNFPDAEVIRQFREKNREALRRLLENVFWAVWKEQHEGRPCAPPNGARGPFSITGADPLAKLKLCFSQEAGRRLRHAEQEDWSTF